MPPFFLNPFHDMIDYLLIWRAGTIESTNPGLLKFRYGLFRNDASAYHTYIGASILKHVGYFDIIFLL